nr:ethylene-responsive transcription factor ERF054 [Ipomoea trifida]
MAAARDRGKAKKAMEEEADEGREFERQQWRPVLEEASMSDRPLKKIRRSTVPLLHPQYHHQTQQQQMISFSPQQQQSFAYPPYFAGNLAPSQHNQQLMQYWNDSLNLSPRGRMIMSRFGHRPPLFIGKDRGGSASTAPSSSSSSPTTPSKRLASKGEDDAKKLPATQEEESSEVTGSDEVQENVESASSELVWNEMAEAWLNAMPAGWGPTSPVWDDLDATNSLMLPSNLPFSDPNQQDHSTSPSSCPMRPFFPNDQD